MLVMRFRDFATDLEIVEIMQSSHLKNMLQSQDESRS
jgi:hypothetical protein